MLQSDAKRGPRDPSLEAQNQKVAKLQAASGVRMVSQSLLSAKNVSKMASGLQNCSKFTPK